MSGAVYLPEFYRASVIRIGMSDYVSLLVITKTIHIDCFYFLGFFRALVVFDPVRDIF